jgi:hypothetical protein
MDEIFHDLNSGMALFKLLVDLIQKILSSLWRAESIATFWAAKPALATILFGLIFGLVYKLNNG